MLSNKAKVISVTGPTCTGKSDLSILLAEKFNGEIVNCDSMQVYRHFDIGTAKPNIGARKSIPHHLIDIVEPQEEFNAARFKIMADKTIDTIRLNNKLPILVGGTGLYLRVLVYGLFKAETNQDLRAALQKEYSEDPLKFYERLKDVDSEYAMRISFRDKVRVVRAMEIFLLTGRKVSEHEKDHGFREPEYDILKIGLKKEKEKLYASINQRVNDMLAQGWVEEVKKILLMGVSDTAKPFSGIGYREILLHIKGFIQYKDMVKEIQKQTRHYAKRQFTWFAKEKDMNWFEYPEDSEKIIRKVSEFLRKWN